MFLPRITWFSLVFCVCEHQSPLLVLGRVWQRFLHLCKLHFFPAELKQNVWSLVPEICSFCPWYVVWFLVSASGVFLLLCTFTVFECLIYGWVLMISHSTSVFARARCAYELTSYDCFSSARTDLDSFLGKGIRIRWLGFRVLGWSYILQSTIRI